MNLVELERKLIAAARAHSPSDRVPYAFEKRVVSRLAASTVSDHAALWARALWRGAAACLAVVIVLSALTLLAPQTHTAAHDLSQDFEKTMLAAVDQDTDSSW